jgi:hypothetical protein
MFLWNLGKTKTLSINQEEQMQTFRPIEEKSKFLLVKGTNQKQNYLFFDYLDSYMDLRSDLPQNFLSGKLFWHNILNPDPKTIYTDYKNELKICSKDSHSIGFYGVART